MTLVSDVMESPDALSIGAVLCIDTEAYDRFGPVLRHLLVGLVDQAVHARLLSSDARIETLTLGPVQTLVHSPIIWPFTKRRIGQLVDALSAQPPTVVHALSRGSYRLAGALAAAFDSDLVLQVASLADCDGIAELSGPRVGRFLAFSHPLQAVLEEQLHVPADRVRLVRPGLRVSERIACFAEAQRTPVILCMSAFGRGSGVEQLIDAVRILRKRDHELMLFLLGQGPREPALRRLIRERKLSSFVTLAHPAGDLGDILGGADIFVRPSSDTAFYAEVLQAMGTGLAIVTFSSTVCDYVRPGETAVVCEKPGTESLAAAIGQLLADRGGARRMATTAAEFVRTYHAVSGMAERTADAYRQLALARATFPIEE